MVIAIIGAGLSGLVAAQQLMQAGHTVTVFEKSRGMGGRMSTRYAKGDRSSKFDHGTPFLSAQGPLFNAFIHELEAKGLIKKWTNKFLYEDADTITEVSAIPSGADLYVALDGMNSIGKYLSRPIDVRNGVRVGGITHFGKKAHKKKVWMLNLDDQQVFEADAVIVALPATQAYGVIQTAQDETSIRRIIREIDEISYNPSLSFMFNFGKQEIPDWSALKLVDPDVSLIINESSKRDFGGDFAVVVHSTPELAIKHQTDDRDLALHQILKVLTRELGVFASNPLWHDIHYWRYARARKTISSPFFECDDPDLPLAIIGDYFKGNDLEASYNSAYALSEYWIKKYSS
jgi:predicted NAD/FAD-dependent oxidoreductase